MTTPNPDDAARIAQLEGALRKLCLGYVNLLETGRDTILFYGGKCDPVDVMEAADPYLREARAALTPATTRGGAGGMGNLFNAPLETER